MPLKRNESGTSPSGQRVEVLARGDLEVVRARDVERERGRAGEAGDERGHVRPAEDLRRRRPALGRRRTARRGARASRRRRPGAPGRSGSASRARSCGSRAPSGRSTCSVEAQRRRRRRARTGSTPRTEKTGASSAGASGLDAHAAPHAVRRRTPRPPRSTPLPPRDALPARLDQADEPVGLVDRDDRVPVRGDRCGRRSSASASGSSRSRTGFAAHSASHAPRSSSDSVAPAGLGYRATTAAADARAHEERRPIGIRNAAHSSSVRSKSVEPRASARPAAGTRGRPSASTSTSRRRR